MTTAEIKRFPMELTRPSPRVGQRVQELLDEEIRAMFENFKQAMIAEFGPGIRFEVQYSESAVFMNMEDVFRIAQGERLETRGEHTGDHSDGETTTATDPSPATQ